MRELKQAGIGNIFTQYQYPQYVNDSTVLALKTGLAIIPRFVLLSRHGAEQTVFTPGQLNIPEMLSVNGGKAVWPEFQQNARWGQRIASELKVLDLKTGRLTRIGRGQRYSAAALSPDGQRLVAVRDRCRLPPRPGHSRCPDRGRNPDPAQPANDFYQQPRWHPDGRRLVAVTLSAAGKTIAVLDPATGTAKTCCPWPT